MPTIAREEPTVRKHRRLLLALFVSLAFVGAGCSSTTDTSATGTTVPTGGSTPGTTAGAATGALTISAATSLTTPFKTIGDDFKKANPKVTEVKFSFDSSSTLATQIQGGAPADGFASADEANMTKLTSANLIAGSPQVFARNRLTIVVKKGNPKGVKTLADLATAGTISLCGSDVPCGKYADQILQTAGVTIPTGNITRGQNVKATLGAVADGDADAGIVYVTDVTGDKVEAVVIPDAQNAVAVYPIATVKASTNQPTMQAFVAYVLSPAGQATLKAAGFLPPT
jgi:molybdate transport system substrate-binding protein